MNFYAWVREGVKRAVLLGFSDAIEAVGTPPEGDESGQQFLAMLRQNKALEGPEPRSSPGSGGGSRKRLGRSLDDIVKSPASGSAPASS
ncbi:MAG: hypothetical protein K2Y37_22375 [Pirellulales bacterium]|nr:hypothetical protein [Pirellulales bacterium]